jgi:hypothetical protein
MEMKERQKDNEVKGFVRNKGTNAVRKKERRNY